MAPSPSAEGPSTPAGGAARGEVLLDLAEAAIDRALRQPEPLAPPNPLPGWLEHRLGAFVTLTVDGRLNGCIGQIDDPEPLATAIGRLAVQAAFEDPRLPPLRASDLSGLEIEVSLLSPMTPVPCRSRAELLDGLRPGIDGLLISSGYHRAVFLPDVWEQLPDPDQFFDHLLVKAGLRPGGWPPDLHASTFTTERFARPHRSAR